MDSDRKRVAANSPGNGVVAGSVWESRMKGSFKVFNGDDNSNNSQEEIGKNRDTSPSEIVQLDKKLRSKQSPSGLSGGGKRKTWQSDGSSEGTVRSPVQIPKVRSDNKKILSEQDKGLSVSMDGIGIKKSPGQIKKGRQEWNKEQSVSIDGIERSPIQNMKKTRSLPQKGGEISDGIEKNSVQLRKVKSVSIDGIGIGISDDSDSNSKKGIEGSIEEIEKCPDENGIKKTGSDSNQNLEEFGILCEEKLINTDESVKPNSPHTLDVEEDDENEQDWDEVTTMEVEEVNEEINEEKAIVVVKEMNVSSTVQKSISPIKKNKSPPEEVVIEDEKIHQKFERSPPMSKTVRKQPPAVVNHPRIVSPKPTITKPIPVADEFPSHTVPKTHGKLQSFIDLVMWKDASKSALIFGLGTFCILSSSYTKDLNISFISVISYMGLVYLAAIFIFRSIIFRGQVEVDNNNTDDEEYVIGEEEAIWVLRLFLPYINEFLLKVKALFSGDPATTMKLAVLLFVLARCGSSITIWKMAKLGFFGVFTVPKICSSYSSQLTAYGTFWIRRFKDAWESCSHKKAAAFGVFTLVWNLSSTVARIWAVFMLFVAFKYYQQSMLRDEGVVEEEATTGRTQNQSSWQGQRRQKIPTSTDVMKPKKRS